MRVFCYFLLFFVLFELCVCAVLAAAVLSPHLFYAFFLFSFFFFSLSTCTRPKNCAEVRQKPQFLTEKEKMYSQLPARRISIIGLKAQMLNGRTGTRVRYLTEGHGKGRFRVLLDGKHEPTEGNFWPKNMLSTFLFVFIRLRCVSLFHVYLQC